MDRSMTTSEGHRPALEITSLRFQYSRSGPVVVDLPAFSLAPGEQVLLTGGSGFGKSTLLQLIAGLLEPNAGTVTVDGQNMHALRGAKRDLYRGRHIGMIFQTFNLLPGFSAAENVMLGLMVSTRPRGEHRDHAVALLKELGIMTPDASPDRMSVGQQQRVAVARALSCEPALVLADEPTASLDPENARTAMDLIQQTCRTHGAALLCTSHDPSLRERFERVESLEELMLAPSR
ncbi:MAG: ABC transporter ATP-binding protein [Phycisphaerales bacterium]|nr:ABC transporter ATP-binding protein [Phycisphaerales bacterium]